MRVVGGQFRGRPLLAPDTAVTRPTSDRVREAAFNILAHSIEGFEFDGIRVLDLFAGSGALGIEALSRGAAFAMFVEEDSSARAAIRQNVEALQLTGVTKIFRRDATRLGEAGKQDGFRLVFIDPPYGRGLAAAALEAAVTGGWLTPGAVIVIEERAGLPVPLPASCQFLNSRIWGETQVVFATYDLSSRDT